MLIKVRPDTVYGVGYVDFRFTVDEAIPESMIPVACFRQLKKGIEDFERLGDGHGHHYKFLDKRPINWTYSHLQADPQVLHEAKEAVNIFDRRNIMGLVDVTARVYFEQPLVVPDEDVLQSFGEDHGFADMPQEYTKRLAEVGEA